MLKSFKHWVKQTLTLKKSKGAWLHTETLTSDRTDSLRDKSLIWGSLLLLIKATGAEVEQFFILKFDPALGTVGLVLVVSSLFIYYFAYWVKSFQSDLAVFKLQSCSREMDVLAETLKKLDRDLKQPNPQFNLKNFPEENLRQLKIDFQLYQKAIDKFDRQASIRNVLFWLFDIMPVPVILIVNLVVLIMQVME